ncbi:MAG TPA: septal ring lytic transglycosylase RlpA family protein [Caldimonas sp.]|jgi:rare lipoprotein A|nr:septal ring lytic transglycosylase RlpA family protein [Caldimonas sp.]HEX4236219.1 septal ring lytic transglycosylase RlpA family protein [Caldimonas sp.]
MACGFGVCSGAPAHGSDAAPEAASARPAATGPALDRTGKKRVGTASVYSHRFAGRTMADGTPMDPRDDNAASRTLPLGTKAKITNLETGQAATVTIQDRGPYAKGRIVDLSPATASKIGLTPKEGVAKVEVKPIDLPAPKRDVND